MGRSKEYDRLSEPFGVPDRVLGAPASVRRDERRHRLARLGHLAVALVEGSGALEVPHPCAQFRQNDGGFQPASLRPLDGPGVWPGAAARDHLVLWQEAVHERLDVRAVLPLAGANNGVHHHQDVTMRKRGRVLHVPPSERQDTGRFTKCTPKVIAKVKEALMAGNYFEAACRYADISPASGFSWLNTARQAVEASPSKPDCDPAFLAFLDAVERADAYAEIEAVAELRIHGQREYRATVEFLKRRFPSRWGDRQHIEADISLTQVLTGIAQEINEKLMQELAAPGDGEADL